MLAAGRRRQAQAIFDRLAVSRGIKLESVRPQPLRGGGHQFWHRGRPGLFMRTVDGPLLPLLAPQPVSLLDVDLTALVVA